MFRICVGLLFLLLLSPAFSQETIDLYNGSDTNISDWYSNSVIPMFQQAVPECKVNQVITGGGAGGNDPIVDRAYAAFKTGDDPKADYFEQFDPFRPVGAMDEGFWVEFSNDNVPNYASVVDAAKETPYNLPYRGSQVLLAYDKTKVAEDEVPHTWDELVAWIKANPGEFIYGRPDRGGSGRNFVVRAVHEANGRDPSLFTVDNFEADLASERFAAAWEILNDLAPYLYDNASYPAGNTPTLQLLAQGAVSMIPAWSDQAIQAINLGVLPESTGLVQLEDLPLVGGYATSTIPSNAANLDCALKFADFVLTPEVQTSVVEEIGGFPAISWDLLPSELQAKFADVITNQVPDFPGGDWNSAMNDSWYENVAPNVNRND
ncbi:MAG: extracellular solute-binding protein [Trueperaceae bacterium]|nr:extracellular solute-binding protein [Trueperaceae bacterium]